MFDVTFSNRKADVKLSSNRHMMRQYNVDEHIGQDSKTTSQIFDLTDCYLVTMSAFPE